MSGRPLRPKDTATRRAPCDTTHAPCARPKGTLSSLSGRESDNDVPLATGVATRGVQGGPTSTQHGPSRGTLLSLSGRESDNNVPLPTPAVCEVAR